MKWRRHPVLAAAVVIGMTISVVAASCGDGSGEAATEGPSSTGSPSDGAMNMPGGAMQMTPLDETVWEGMVIRLATAPPATHSLFQGDAQSMITPTPEDSMHLMAVLSDEDTGERIPYANVWLTIKDEDGAVIFDERMWPMLSQAMGTHYGINVPLPGPGRFDAVVLVGPPQAARHPEYMERWLEPFTFETTVDWER